MDYKQFIRFGKKGDISLLLQDKKIFQTAIDDLIRPFLDSSIDKIVAIEARGFLFAGPIAYLLGAGIVMARKTGGLPLDVLREKFVDYTGKRKGLEIHKDAIERGERILIIDDWVETGAQAKAAAKMVKKLGGIIVGFAFLVDGANEEAKKFLADYQYHCLIKL